MYMVNISINGILSLVQLLGHYIVHADCWGKNSNHSLIYLKGEISSTRLLYKKKINISK
jgi:hypothetical protein